MSASFAALLYLVAGALFIMALRGLSNPESARAGNTYGMVGMAIAVLTTLAIAAPSDPTVWLLIIAGIAIGGAIGAFAAWMFYYRASRPLGFGMLAVFVAMLWFNRWLHAEIGTGRLLWLAVSVFVLAWIAQFIGHKIEGKRPSFLTDLVYLMIGPAWILGKLYRKLGWKF